VAKFEWKAENRGFWPRPDGSTSQFLNNNNNNNNNNNFTIFELFSKKKKKRENVEKNKIK
jgi:hypothetical protein